MTAADAELIGLVSDETKNLLIQIRKDIEETEAISKEDRMNCEAICQRVETEHNRLKIEFLNESLTLIDQALKTSDQQILKQCHQAWSVLLENVSRQCKALVGPLLEVLQVLSRQDKKLKQKYHGFIGGAVVSSLLVGATIGLIIAHCHPGCVLQLAVETVVLVVGGALIALLVAVGCITGSIVMARLRTVYRRCSDSVRLILAKYFPDYFDGPCKDPSKLDLATVITNAIDTLNLKDDLWGNRVALEMIKRTTQSQLQRLQQLQ